MNVSTKTVRCGSTCVVGAVSTAMRDSFGSAHQPPDTGVTSASSSPASQRAIALGMGPGDDGQGGVQRFGQRGLVGGQAGERVGHRGAVVELEPDDRRGGQPREPGAEAHPHLHLGASLPPNVRDVVTGLLRRGRWQGQASRLAIITCSIPASRKTSPYGS